MKQLLFIVSMWSCAAGAEPTSLDYWYLDQFAVGGHQRQMDIVKRNKFKRWLIRESKRNVRVAGVHVLGPFFKEKIVSVLNATVSMHSTSNTKIRFKATTDDYGVGLYGKWNFE